MLRVSSIFAAAFLALAQAAAAQDFSSPISPILILDSEQVLRSTVAARRVSGGIEDDIAALTAENRRIEEELEAEERDLTERRAEMEAQEFRALADAFDRKVQRIRSEQDAKQRELQLRQEQEQQDFLQAIAPILSEIGNEYGAVVILERRNVLLAADGIDITDEAIERINAFLERSGPEGGDGAEAQPQ